MAVSGVQAKGVGMKKLLPMDTMLINYSFLLHQHIVNYMLKKTSKSVSMHGIIIFQPYNGPLAWRDGITCSSMNLYYTFRLGFCPNIRIFMKIT